MKAYCCLLPAVCCLLLMIGDGDGDEDGDRDEDEDEDEDGNEDGDGDGDGDEDEDSLEFRELGTGERGGYMGYKHNRAIGTVTVPTEPVHGNTHG